ncbi:MAG: RnfABCDGE type electron transport complex subunit D [Deltaproteobacteria bacterium]|nr:RnfABCDGE type electron transport complex subunit D [Deltaproteobacteria bacterium]
MTPTAAALSAPASASALATDVGVQNALVDDRSWLSRLRDRNAWIVPGRGDPRWLFVCFHSTYVLMGHFLLSFNRSGEQIAIALLTCAALEVVYTYLLTRMFIFPLSGVISGLGLALLFSAPGNTWLMLLVSWMTMTGKFIVTWKGHHIYNPTNLALVLILLFSGGQAAVSPAYQWGGAWQPVALVFLLGTIIMWRAKKLPLVVSFWAFYCLGAVLRAQLTHMPTDITLWAQISGGAFWLFSFFMITDPKTSPPDTRGQIFFGVGIALLDVWLQLNTAVYSLVYALFLACTIRFVFHCAKELRASSASLPLPAAA